MIDALDKQTQALPLEPVKRGRGRPRTGNAMTPAEKQRAYRERQKTAAGNVTKKDEGYVQILETARDTMHDRIEFLQRRIDDLVRENQGLKSELAERAKPRRQAPQKRRYVLQYDMPDGSWVDDKMGDYSNKKEAEAACKRLIDKGNGAWRVRERQWV